SLYWTAYTPGDGQRHPAVLVLHAGGFRAGNADPSGVAQDLATAGFFALATEYRLPPPHIELNSHTGNGANHPVPGQDDVTPVDDGHYPEQTTDVQMAIRTARADNRCNGLVYIVGASAGGCHAAYMAATGVAGDDRPDLIVVFSGIYDLADPNFLGLDC